MGKIPLSHYLLLSLGRLKGYQEPHKNPVGFYQLNINNRNTRPRCEICSKLTIKTPERRQWRRSDVFNGNFEHTSHAFLVFLLLTLNMYLPSENAGSLSTHGSEAASHRRFSIKKGILKNLTKFTGKNLC